jgi:hypothetical protein
MEKFIFKVFKFILPIILIFCLIELFYRVVPNNYSFKSETIKKKYNSAEILVLGSSHTFYGINPKFLKSPTFNLAQISQTLYFDKLLFEKHINEFDKLKYLILNIEYTTLSQRDNTDDDVWRKYYYEAYMDLNVPIISKFDIERYFLSFTKSFNFNTKLIYKYIFNGSILNCDENGFGTDYTVANKDPNFKNNTKEIIKRHEDNLMDFSLNVHRIQKMIDMSKKKGIKVVLIITPATKEYVNGVNQYKWNKIVETCNLLSQKNDNVSFLNLFDDTRFTDDDLFDTDHLNEIGAQKCTRILNDILN